MSYKAGFIGLVGLPNAGKSTLVNAIVGEKVSIVTSKPQTTRKRVMGLLSDEASQLVFVDAPGVIRADKGLNEFLVREYAAVIEESDVLLAVLNLDAEDPQKLLKIIEMVRMSKKPWIAVITKSDLDRPERIGVLRANLLIDNVPVITLSALKDPEFCSEEIRKLVKPLLPDAKGPLFDEEIYTTESIRNMTSEIVREAAFELLHLEVPYGLTVKIQKFEENDGRLYRIMADIIVEKESHRPIVIGQRGKMIKDIGTRARMQIEKLVDSRVYLELHVVVKEKWTHDQRFLKEFGYVAQE